MFSWYIFCSCRTEMYFKWCMSASTQQRHRGTGWTSLMPVKVLRFTLDLDWNEWDVYTLKYHEEVKCNWARWRRLFFRDWICKETETAFTLICSMELCSNIGLIVHCWLFTALKWLMRLESACWDQDVTADYKFSEFWMCFQWIFALWIPAKCISMYCTC